jgi:hypothetical protein
MAVLWNWRVSTHIIDLSCFPFLICAVFLLTFVLFRFQCYDRYMLNSLSAAASRIGQSDWGHGGPDDAGTYNSHPSDTGFFSDGTQDNYNSPYGDFFLGTAALF